MKSFSYYSVVIALCGSSLLHATDASSSTPSAPLLEQQPATATVEMSTQTDNVESLPLAREVAYKPAPFFYQHAGSRIIKTLKKWYYSTECNTALGALLLASLSATTLSSLGMDPALTTAVTLFGGIAGGAIGYINYARNIYPNTPEGLFVDIAKRYHDLSVELSNDSYLKALTSPDATDVFCSAKYSQLPTLAGQTDAAKNDLKAKLRALKEMQTIIDGLLTSKTIDLAADLCKGLKDLEVMRNQAFNLVLQKLSFIIQHEKHRRDAATIDKREVTVKGLLANPAVAVSL